MRSVVSILLPLIASAAFASNSRSAVSVNGLDTNTCTVASPCRSFGVAIAATAAGGEVVALDSAGYGPFSISSALTISGAPGVHAAITVSSGNGINVAASFSDNIVLRNLVLIGSGGAIGINQTGGLTLVVTDCLVRGFSIGGIFASDVDGRMIVDHCALLDNLGAYGIYTDGGTFPTALDVTNSDVQGNAVGIFVGYHSDAAIVNTNVTGNSAIGITAHNVFNGGSSTDTRVIVENCTIAHNMTGISSDAASLNNTANVVLSQNVIAYNTTGASTGGVGVVTSFANNRFVGNGTDGGPFASIAFE